MKKEYFTPEALKNFIKNKTAVAFCVAVLALFVLSFWFLNEKSAAKNPFPISAAAVSSWNFKGIYSGDKEQESRVFSEIKRLNDLLGKGEHSDYSLHIGISGQYELIGDGKKSYKHISKALAIDSEKTGLAWHNMGKLMEKLGAYQSARIAFEKAVKAEAAPVYYISLADFLKRYFPEDSAAIKEAEQALRIPSDE